MKSNNNESNYFERSEVSNSDLGALKKAIYNIESPPNLDFHFSFGSLVDAMLTEDEDVVNGCLKAYDFTDAHIEKAHRMVAMANKDPFAKLLLKTAEGQVVRTNILEFDNFTLPCRCKFDLLAKGFDIGLDFKTLGIDSEKTFYNAIDHFDYDRQASFYMDIAEINRFMIFAMSKKKDVIFKVAIERGGHRYKQGKSKYVYWCKKYYELIYKFKIK